MKIKDGCQASSSEFWYDISQGGYLKPEEILENPEDVEKVQNAVKTLMDFEGSCEEQIEGFVQ